MFVAFEFMSYCAAMLRPDSDQYDVNVTMIQHTALVVQRARKEQQVVNSTLVKCEMWRSCFWMGTVKTSKAIHVL